MRDIGWLSSEKKVIERIVADTQILANTIHFALESAFPYPEQPYAQNINIAINVPREKLGLSSGEKPGDIDLLMVPFNTDHVFYERTIGLEIKVVRPTQDKPGRNVNSMGRTQSIGLLHSGFPFVGLIHVSIPEPLPVEMHWRVPIISTKPGGDGQRLESGEYGNFDPFPLISAQRQEGRLLALDLPEEIGYRAIAMHLSKNGQSFSGNTIDEEKCCVINPKLSEPLVTCIEVLFANEPALFRTIVWRS